MLSKFLSCNRHTGGILVCACTRVDACSYYSCPHARAVLFLPPCQGCLITDARCYAIDADVTRSLILIITDAGVMAFDAKCNAFDARCYALDAMPGPLCITKR